MPIFCGRLDIGGYPTHLAQHVMQFEQDFTTNCPDDHILTDLMRRQFKGTEKDYTVYIDVLKAVGIQPGRILYDYGCSWGYGSYQFAQAGYRVYSYEIGASRADFAAEKLGCQMLSEPEQIPDKADCFFSAHVI